VIRNYSLISRRIEALFQLNKDQLLQINEHLVIRKYSLISRRI
jgi:hypothetical protein